MKSALSVLAVFFSILIFGTLLGAAVFMLYENLTLYITGLGAAPLTMDFFIRGIVFAFPGMCVLSTLMSILYLIRHAPTSFLPFVFYVALNFLVWGLMLPQCLVAGTKYNSKTFQQKFLLISPGFFRNEDKGISFYTKVTEDSKVDGIFIDIKGIHGESGRIIRIADYPYKHISDQDFSDILIENAVQMPVVVQIPFSLYFTILEAALVAWKNGYLCYLAFASIGLVFTAAYGLKRISEWKFLNCCCCILLFIGILVFNGTVRIVPFLEKISLDMTVWWTSVLEKAPSWLSVLGNITEPFVFFVNIISAFILTLTGIILYSMNHSSKSNESGRGGK